MRQKKKQQNLQLLYILASDSAYYLTWARSEPASDPVKPLIGKSVSGFVHATSDNVLDRSGRGTVNSL